MTQESGAGNLRRGGGYFLRLVLGIFILCWLGTLRASPLVLDAQAPGQHIDAQLWVDPGGNADLEMAEGGAR
ncbi:MAG TPA: hypothetical protein VFK74_08280, partial [Azospira sp.]|nr:hypothetical protein [Azospira sp.]